MKEKCIKKFSQNAHSKFNTSIDFWIGEKSFIAENITGVWTWTWNRALMTYSNWQKDEPYLYQSCVASNTTSALWHTEHCDIAKPFVCQIPAMTDVCDPDRSYFEDSN